MAEGETIYLKCPFCGEEDFDAIGLKIHLQRWCEPFDAIDVNGPRRDTQAFLEAAAKVARDKEPRP